MRATLVLLACVFAVAVALPAVEVTKNAAPNVPGLQGILLQAENGVEAVRKSRQLGLGGGLLGGGLLGGGFGGNPGYGGGYNQGYGGYNQGYGGYNQGYGGYNQGYNQGYEHDHHHHHDDDHHHHDDHHDHHHHH